MTDKPPEDSKEPLSNDEGKDESLNSEPNIHPLHTNDRIEAHSKQYQFPS